MTSMHRAATILNHISASNLAHAADTMNVESCSDNAQENKLVIVSVAGNGLMTVALNRPAQLNSLNTHMVQLLTKALLHAKSDSEVRAVLIRGEGKAFCAGGDIRSLALASKIADWKVHENFFGPEFVLDHLIYTFPKPVICLLDGICMGGGVGISIGATFRVVTENVLFAMPETGIGFFPDVSGSYFLPRMPGRLGWYIALTGARLKAADCIYTGVATHRIHSADIPNLLKKLSESPVSKESIASILQPFCSAVQEEEAPLKRARAEIDRFFSASNDFAAVMSQLEQSAPTSAFAKQTLNTLAQKSPTSLLVTMEELKRGSQQTLEQCLQMEYAAALYCMRTVDFYEGVRAVVLEKDNKPKWNPHRWQDVRKETVDAFFHFRAPKPLQFINK